MTMKLVDGEIVGKLVDIDGKWFLRLTAPSISEQLPDYQYLWYEWTHTGWYSLIESDHDRLEKVYQGMQNDAR